MQKEADCFSILYLRDKLGYTQEKIDMIYDFTDINFSKKRADGIIECLVDNPPK